MGMNSWNVANMRRAGIPLLQSERDALRAAKISAEMFCDFDQPGDWYNIEKPEPGDDMNDVEQIFINDTGIDPRMWEKLTPEQRKMIPRRLRQKK